MELTPVKRWPGWAHLPRDTRDVLFLLGVIGWTVLPHLMHLPWWCGALAAVVLVWRGHLALNSAPLPSRWWVLAVLAIAIGLTLNTHRTLLGKEAGVTLLVVLMVLKTLELRARRDALVVFFLGFFLVLTNFLYSQSLAVAGAMLVSVWGLLTALVLAHMPVGQPGLRQAGSLAGRAALIGAPIMLLLFLLFPRFGPLWGLPSDAMASTGLSGTMKLGAMAEVANDDSIALRVRFSGAVPPQHQLYFRGPVLSVFDGIEWRRPRRVVSAPYPTADEARLGGAPVPYEMTLEPSRLTMLPLLELTPDRDDAAPRVEGWQFRLAPGMQWVSDRIVSERLRFTAMAWPLHQHGPQRLTPPLFDELELPPGYNPRTLAWAAALRRELPTADAHAIAQALYRHIGTAGYTYTLAPGSYDGPHSVDEFWLDRKLGFCEHFAASFVVVMRALGVPARIVTGYQGADPAPVDGYTIVRQRNAHAWAEYWQAGEGWVRADPTAAVAPDRIEQGESLAPTPGAVAGALYTVSPALMAQLRAGWERINNRWNQWVLNYSRGNQLDLLRWLGVQAPKLADLALLLATLLSGGALAGAAWAAWDRHRQDPWQRLYGRVRDRLGVLGVAVGAHEPLRGVAARVRKEFGAEGDALAQTLETLDRMRYGQGALRRPDRTWWRHFTHAAANLARGT